MSDAERSADLLKRARDMLDTQSSLDDEEVTNEVIRLLEMYRHSHGDGALEPSASTAKFEPPSAESVLPLENTSGNVTEQAIDPSCGCSGAIESQPLEVQPFVSQRNVRDEPHASEERMVTNPLSEQKMEYIIPSVGYESTHPPEPAAVDQKMEDIIPSLAYESSRVPETEAVDQKMENIVPSLPYQSTRVPETAPVEMETDHAEISKQIPQAERPLMQNASEHDLASVISMESDPLSVGTGPHPQPQKCLVIQPQNTNDTEANAREYRELLYNKEQQLAALQREVRLLQVSAKSVEQAPNIKQINPMLSSRREMAEMLISRTCNVDRHIVYLIAHRDLASHLVKHIREHVIGLLAVNGIPDNDWNLSTWRTGTADETPSSRRIGSLASAPDQVSWSDSARVKLWSESIPASSIAIQLVPHDTNQLQDLMRALDFTSYEGSKSLLNACVAYQAAKRYFMYRKNEFMGGEVVDAICKILLSKEGVPAIDSATIQFGVDFLDGSQTATFLLNLANLDYWCRAKNPDYWKRQRQGESVKRRRIGTRDESFLSRGLIAGKVLIDDSSINFSAGGIATSTTPQELRQLLDINAITPATIFSLICICYGRLVARKFTEFDRSPLQNPRHAWYYGIAEPEEWLLDISKKFIQSEWDARSIISRAMEQTTNGMYFFSE
jgi:hypothetical protein